MVLRRPQRNLIYLVLALGLFLYAAYIRFALVHVLPDPTFTPDSEDYLHPVFNFLGHGKFDLENQRTPGYPFFLFCLLRITHSFLPILVIQHGLTLATAALAAILYYRFFEKSVGCALFLFFWVSVLPQEVAYGQMILTETLYAFLVMVFLVGFLNGAINSGTAAWLFVGMVVSIAILTRPVGWTLFLTVWIALPFFQKGRPLLHSLIMFSLPFVTVMGMYLGYNQLSRNFTGFDQMGGVVLFDSTARFLDVESIPDRDLRNLLLPIWKKYRREIDNPNWVYGSVNSPVKAIQQDPRYKERAMTVMTALAIRAIKDHPFQFLNTQFRLLIYFFRYGSVPYLQPKADAFYQGLPVYWNATIPYPAARDWLTFKPDDIRTHFDQIRHSPAYPYQATTLFTKPLYFIPETMCWLPMMALMGFLILFRRRDVQPLVGFFLVVIFIHILLTNLARGIESEVRYAIPLEPMYCILILAGFRKLIGRDRMPV
jgi:hypothetical protein